MMNKKQRKQVFLDKISPMTASKRMQFDAKHDDMEQKRAMLNARIEKLQAEFKLKSKELEVKYAYDKDTLEQKQKQLVKQAKKAFGRAKYNVEWVYVRGGHAKNEFLGFLTVFNFDGGKNINIKRHVGYDGKDPSLYLDIYQRKDRDMTKKAQVFVYIHGGGWIGGLPETREGFTTKIAESGYFTVSLYYGHSPFYAHPKPVENIYKAFAWLKEHAEEYNIDTSSIFVGGESAGGHLSSMVGAIASNPEYRAHFDLPEESKEQKIKGLVLNCGVYDLKKALTTGFKNIRFYVQSYCGGTPYEEMDEQVQKEMSPIFWVTKDFPPTYAISAENDKLAVLTFDLVEKLDDLKVPVTHYHGEGKWAVHAFAVAQILKITKQAMAGAKKFMYTLSGYEQKPKRKHRKQLRGGKKA